MPASNLFSSQPVSSLSLSPHTPSTPSLLSLFTNSSLTILPLSTASSIPPHPPSLTSLPPITSLSFASPTSLFACDSRGSLHHYSVDPTNLHPSLAQSLPAAHNSAELTSISASESLLASAGKDALIRLWDPATLQCRARLAGHRYDVRDVAIDHVNHLVVSAGRDRTVRIWDERMKKEVAIMRGHTGWVHAVDVAEGVIVSAGGDKSVRVWDLAQRAQKQCFMGHEYRVWSVALDEEGKKIVSGSTDATVRLWDIDEGQEKVFEGHGDTVWCVDLKGGRAVSGCEDGGVFVWNVGPGNNTGQKEGLLVDIGGEESVENGMNGIPKAMDEQVLPVEKEIGQTLESDTKTNELEKIVPDVDVVKKVVAEKVEQAPEYDKSAAELVNALKRIQELEKTMAEVKGDLKEREAEVDKLKMEGRDKDAEIIVLKKQVEASTNLVNAANVRALLASNPRKADLTLDYEEPVNKIGAVTDQLSALAARLDAMIATN